jgi:hypothetical protein
MESQTQLEVCTCRVANASMRRPALLLVHVVYMLDEGCTLLVGEARTCNDDADDDADDADDDCNNGFTHQQHGM